MAEESKTAPFACCCERFFEITVKGHLPSTWSEWLEGLDVTQLDSGEMVLCGTIIDQAALMGILSKLDRLGLDLLSICHVEQAQK